MKRPDRGAVTVTVATRDDAAELAAVAAATFPLACPPAAEKADVDAVITADLSERRFTEYVTDPDRVVLAARRDGAIVGYAMLVRDHDVELSKMYVLAEHHRTGAADELMIAGLRWAGQHRAARVWLGVNQVNERAQRFYRRHGFEVAGTRQFRLGSRLEDDFVMVRAR